MKRANRPLSMNTRINRLLFSLLLPLLSLSPFELSHAAPVRVFILAGQSNMEGQAVVDLAGRDYNEGRGTLVQVMADPSKTNLYRHLKNSDGSWVVREDVLVRYQRENAPLLKGPLAFGFSIYGGTHHFGPEFQFGHRLGDFFKEPVLLIKTAWGGKSLYRDFRPPSAGGQTGRYYQLMIQQVREALEKMETDFPSTRGLGYELSGFVWYHGWNDGVDPQNAVPEYRQNLIHLIKDVRKEFNAPKLPVVIGELTGPWVDAPAEWTRLREAQAAAAKFEEFAGTVAFVKTRDFVRRPEDSPNPGHGHHEFGNAETYFLVGDALAKGMLALLPKPAVRFDPVIQNVEGWEVSVDPALLSGPDADLGARALSLLANHLQRIKILMPRVALERMQKLGIWIELDHPVLKSMQYHPSRQWLESHGHDPRLARKVHITQAAELLSPSQMLKHPAVVLHELAHAYHDQVLGFDHAEIRTAFERARASGSYERVLLYTGDRVRHYALTDHKEYFAEGTEAYFYRNDFYPFVRAELKEHDPTLYELMGRIWGADPKAR